MKRRPYVFISYSHDDAGFASGLAARLNKSGIPYFRDTEEIEWGEDIPDRVHMALNEATHLVVLISPGSEQSAWVAYEMGYARGRQITLVPYLLHPRMRVPGFIENIRYMKTRSDEAKFVSTLGTAVRRAAGSLGRGQADSKASLFVRPDKEVAEALKNIKSLHPQTRRDAVDALVRHQKETELMQLLSYRDPKVRSAAAAGLSQLKAKDALSYIVEGLGFTSSRSRTPIIPDAEDVLVHYGSVALGHMLDVIPDRFENYREGDRWIRAMANVVDEKTVPLLLTRAKETGRKEFLDAALKSGQRLRKDELEEAINSYLAREDNAHWAHANVAAWLAGSPHSEATWVHEMIKRWLESDLSEYGPRSKDYEWWFTEGLLKTSISIEAIVPEDLERLSKMTHNSNLADTLLMHLRRWTRR